MSLLSAGSSSLDSTFKPPIHNLNKLNSALMIKQNLQIMLYTLLFCTKAAVDIERFDFGPYIILNYMQKII
jgi:hypothetical protein